MLFVEQLSALPQFFFSKPFGINWLDVVILLVLLFYAIEGFSIGLVASFIDLCSFVLSFFLALTMYGFFARLLVVYMGVPIGFANAIGFFAVALLFEVFLNFLARLLYKKIVAHFPRQSFTDPNIPYAYVQTFNNFFGIFPGLASGFVLLTFLLTMIISLPFSPFLKHSVAESKIGGPLVGSAQGLERDLNQIFGRAVGESLNFMTIKPQSEETVSLHFTTTDVRVDEKAEQEMLASVNKEREDRGLSRLVIDDSLQQLARSYAREMFAKGYFSHYSPDGLSPFDRMAKAEIAYTYAGENLALAPSTAIAMQGLMNSAEHKANILSPHFQKVGIGVIDGGIYGEMFVQEFTD